MTATCFRGKLWNQHQLDVVFICIGLLIFIALRNICCPYSWVLTDHWETCEVGEFWFWWFFCFPLFSLKSPPLRGLFSVDAQNTQVASDALSDKEKQGQHNLINCLMHQLLFEKLHIRRRVIGQTPQDLNPRVENIWKGLSSFPSSYESKLRPQKLEF